MRSFVLDGLLALVLCMALTWVLRHLAHYFGWLDHPAPPRKLQAQPIPRIGGVGVMLAAGLAVVTLRWWQYRYDRPHYLQTTNLHVLLFPLLLVFLTGLLDDLINLRWWIKLAAEAAAALWLAHSGWLVHLPLLQRISPGLANHLSAPITVLWLLVCANAMNLIDGMDGLASGIALLATLTLMMAAMITGNFALLMLTLPLAGALIGFLAFNFNPATIYLGDSGSLTIGFLLGAFGIIWSEKSTTLVAMTVPVMALALPLFDTGHAIVRRWRRGKSLFAPDHDHIHHQLLRLGVGPKRAVILLYAVAGALALGSLAIQRRFDAELAPTVLALSAAAWFGIQALGFEGMQPEGERADRISLRRALARLAAVQTTAERLANAADGEAAWLGICSMASQVGATYCAMEWNSGWYRQVNLAEMETSAPHWKMEIPILDEAGAHLGLLVLAFGRQANLSSIAAGKVVALFQSSLAAAGSRLLVALQQQAAAAGKE